VVFEAIRQLMEPPVVAQHRSGRHLRLNCNFLHTSICEAINWRFTWRQGRLQLCVYSGYSEVGYTWYRPKCL
jgi:hypothetical protein